MKTFLFFIALYFSLPVFSQNKMELDDLNIKGELLGDNRIQMLNREQNKLENHVEYRTNFRKEIIEGLERPLPKYKIH